MKTKHFYTFVFLTSFTSYSISFTKNQPFWDAIKAFFYLKKTQKERAEQQAGIPPLM